MFKVKKSLGCYAAIGIVCCNVVNYQYFKKDEDPELPHELFPNVEYNCSLDKGAMSMISSATISSVGLNGAFFDKIINLSGE